MSRRFRRLLYGLGALTVLVFLAAGILSTPWAQGVIGRRIVTGLENLTGGKIHVASFKFNPLLLRATFHEIVLRGRESAADPPLFSAKTMVVQLHLSSLVLRKILLHSLDWDEAVIHVSTQPNGTTNVPEPLVSLLPRMDSTDVLVERVTLARTQFYWNEQRLFLNVEAQNVAFLLRQKGSLNYTGSLSTSELRIKSHDRPLPDIALSSEFELSPGRFKVTSFMWKCAGLRGNGSLRLTDWANPTASLSLQANGDIKGLAKSLGLPDLRAGTVEIRSEVTYRNQVWSAEGKIETQQISLHTSSFNVDGLNFSSQFSANSREVEFPRFTASALGSVAEGHGRLVLLEPGPKFSVRARLRGLSLAALGSLSGASWARNPGYSAEFSGTLDAAWTGRFRDFESAFDLRLQPQLPPSPERVPLTGLVVGRATASPDFALEIRDAQFQTARSTLSARGSVSLRQARLALHLALADLADLSPALRIFGVPPASVPVKLNSQATFTGELSGPPTRPEFRGHIEIGSFQFRDSTWDRVEANVRAEPNLLEIASARLARGKSAVELTASIPLANWRLESSEPLRILARADRAPLEGLQSALALDYPIQGLLSGRLDLIGTFGNLSGRGEALVEKGAVLGEPIDRLSAKLRIENSTWYINDVLLKKGSGGVKGHADFNPLSRALAVDLSGSHFGLAEFDALKPSGKNSPIVQGQFGFEIRGSGTLDNPNFKASWHCRGVGVNGATVGDFEGQANWQGREVRLEIRSQGETGIISLDGTALTEAEWPFELSGTYTNLRVDPWLQLLSGRKRDARVFASGTVSLRGPVKDAKRIEVSTHSQTVEVRFPSVTWKNELPVDLHYANRKLTANRFRISGPSTALEIEGSIQLGPSPALALTAQGTSDATILSILDPGIQASGRSDVKLRVGGSPEHPLLYGTISVHGANLSYADFPFRLTGLTGEVALDGDRATLRPFRGTSGGGTVDLSGFVTFADTPRFNLQAILGQVRIRYPIDLTSVLDGTLKLTGSTERAQIGGELIVRRISPGENFNWLARLGEAAATSGVKPPALASPFAPLVRLDIQVSSASPVRFETHDLRLVGEIDMHLQGTLANPVQVGTLQIISGEVVFRGNRYQLEHGYINLTNPYRTQPVLDIEARTRVQRYDLTVNVSGPLERIRISYRSDPPLPTSEIVSLLAFGYASQEEMATQTNQPVQTVGASALLSQALSTGVSGRIQRLFGVSRIKVDPNLGGLGYTAGGARVTVEQQMTRDLTLTYVTTTTTSQQRIIQFEWNISDRISLLGLRDQNGILGMELKFRQRFK
ncbi:MAG: translocation/assembly module TamB domain-containing protein [Terriglobia bacterium]